LRIRPDELPSLASTGDKLFQAFVLRTLLVGRNPIIDHDDGDRELIKERSQLLWRVEAIFGVLRQNQSPPARIVLPRRT
jgi:hypothetical protein